MPERRAYDYLGSFPKGINSDTDPLLLPIDELSFASNATVRGDYVAQRPNYNTITLSYDSPLTYQGLQSGLFQGAQYFNPAPGLEYVILAVGGKLYEMSFNANVASVTTVPLPDSGNSPTATVTWMWQSERWLIWNDGINLPIFYDGVTARRSLGNAESALATLANGFTVPGYNVPVAGNIQINGPYTGALGIAVLINGATYTLTGYGEGGAPVPGYVGCTLNGISGSYKSGDNLVPGATLSVNNAYVGTIIGATMGGSPITTWPAAPVPSTPAQEVTITPTSGGVFSTSYSAYYAANNPTNCINYANEITVADGNQLDIGGGGLVTVTSFATNATGQITSITFTPNAQYTGQIGGNVIQNSANNVVGGNNPSRNSPYVNGPIECSGVAVYYAIQPSQVGDFVVQTGFYNISTSDGSANWGSPGASSTPNYFTLVLNQTFVGNVGDTLNVGGALMTVTSKSGASIVCQMQNNNFQGNQIPILATALTPPTTAQVVVDETASGALTAVATYPFTNGAASPANNGNFPVASTMTFPDSGIPASGVIYAQKTPIAPGMIVQITNPSGQPGNGDLLFVTSVGVTSGGSNSTYYISLTNQTDTPSGYEPAGSVIYPVPNLPVGQAGIYADGRNWVSLPGGRGFLAGDTVGSSSGTFQDGFLDAVLNDSQNVYLAGGGTFILPSAGGSIKAMMFMASLDTSLGQGPVEIFTDRTVFSCSAPANITAWSSVTNPILTPAVLGSGAVSQNSVLQENGDIFYRAPDGSIRSLLMARLDFNSWGKTPISREVIRSLESDNLSLLYGNSGAVFNNRLLMLCQPTLTPRGVSHAAMVSLLFDPLSTLGGKEPSVWEGQWDANNSLQLVTGFFSGQPRCFSICLTSGGGYPTGNAIQVQEILLDAPAYNDNNDTDQVTWFFESSSRFNEPNHQYKRLIDGEIFLDELDSDISVQVFYKPDQYPTWVPWYTTNVSYKPLDPGFRPRVGLGLPDAEVYDPVNNRPLREAYTFQFKVQVTGHARFLGGRFAADLIDEPEFAQPQ